MARLALSLLGSFNATLDGALITTFESAKVRALLAYLAAEADRPHRRESLATLLWPDWPQQSAMSNLRYALADLRKNIGDRDAQPPFLLITRESIQLNREADVWLDVREFEFSIRNPQSSIINLQSAIAHYRGEFLEGFSLPDSPPFEQWVLARREGLHRQALQALFSLSEAHEQKGELEAALPYARRQVALEPWHEQGQQQLMRLLALSGQRSAALAQYEACRKALADELNVEPSSETKRLYEAIRDEDLQGIRDRETGEKLLPPTPYPLPPAPGDPPFKGLQYFDTPDAGLFFGRETLTARLVGHIREMVDASVGASRSDIHGSMDDREGSPLKEGCCFLAVVGASGSGKSSVVRAGVVPALQKGEPLPGGALPPEGSPSWHIHVFTPTAHPLEALAVSLIRETRSVSDTAKLMDDLAQEPRSLHLYAQHLLAPQSPGLAGKCRLLLVVDQFEELFTLCRSEAERAAFLDNLLTAVQGGGSTQVVIVLRADFYGHCAQYPLLRQALCSRQEYIGPMNADELRRAIEEPARQNGWEFDPGLADLILRDIGVSQDHPPEPGALPLLEHALLETWSRRSGRTLTLKGYAEAGGVHGAIAKTAESVFTRLTPEQQALARRIFLRLTELGEGTQDTRRRAPLIELSPHPEDTPQVENLLKTLADARLITLSEDTAEVAHEALIREWPALRLWLSEDREGLHLHRRLTESAEAWAELDRDAGELYRGARLAQAAEWATQAGNIDELNELEREFLQMSQQQAEREAAEQEAQRQRELETAKKLAETEKERAEQQAYAAKRLRRRAWQLVGALGVALLLVVVTFWLAQVANTNATQARANARQANAEANTRATAEARALAEQATAQAERNRADEQKNTAQSERSRAENNAAEALAAQSTAQADRSRAEDSAAAALAAQSTAQAERNRANINAAEARAAQAEAEKSAQISFARELEKAAAANLYKDANLSILLAMQAISVSRSVGVTDTWGSQQIIHDALQTQLLYTTPPGPQFFSGLSFTPDGKWMASGSKPTTYVWDATNGQVALRLPGTRNDAHFSPDGKFLATGSDTPQDKIKIWDVSGLGQDGFTPTVVLTLTAPGLNPGQWIETRIAFSPDGMWLAASLGDLFVQVWNISLLSQADFQPGQTLAQPVKTLSGIPGNWISSIDFSPDSAYVVASVDAPPEGEPDRSFVWDVASGQKFAELPGWRAVFHPQDAHILATSYMDTGNITVWNIAYGQALEEKSFQTGGGVGSLAFSPDGSLLAVGMMWGEAPGDTYVFDLDSGSRRFLLPQNDIIVSLAFSPDGSRLAASNFNNPVVNVYRLVPFDEAPSMALVKTVSDIGYNGVYRTAFVDLSYKTIDIYENAGWQRVAEFTPPYNLDEWGSAWGISPAQITSVAISPEPDRLATSVQSNVVTVWNYTTNQRIFDLTLSTPVVGLSYSPDGKLLATSDAHTITLWNMDTGLVQAVLTDTHGVAAPRSTGVLSFSPDGKQLATVDDQNFVVIWEVASRQEVSAFLLDQPGASIAIFSPDGKRLATCCGGSKVVKIWDLQSGHLEHVLADHFAPVFNVFFSPDSRYILTSSMWDNKFYVWEVTSGRKLLTFTALKPYFWGPIFFTPDGKFIENLEWNLLAKFTWRKFTFDLDELLVIARTYLTRWWTPEECWQYLHTSTCPPRPQP